MPPARFAAARASHFSCFAKKSNQKKATPGIRLFPAVLATRGTRTNRPTVALTRNQWAHGAGLRPRVAPLLGAHPWGPVELTLDRFAMEYGNPDTSIRACEEKSRS